MYIPSMSTNCMQKQTLGRPELHFIEFGSIVLVPWRASQNSKGGYRGARHKIQMRALGQAHKLQNASAPDLQMVMNDLTPFRLHQFGILLDQKWPSQKGTSRLATTLYWRMCDFKVDFAK